MDTAIQGTTIEVSNLEHSRRFYEEILGFKADDFYEPMKWVAYQFGASFFAIREIPDLPKRDNFDITNFKVADVEALYKKVKDRIEVVEGLAHTPWGSYKFVVRDPRRLSPGFCGRGR
jgi:catechol 2,3-dioxygenase-like lactoylglutathione lyase family enzyme